MTKPTGAIKVKDETLWLSSEAGARQWYQGTHRTSLLSAVRKAQVYRDNEEGCRRLHVSAQKNSFIHFLSSLFLMSHPTVIFAFSHFFVMLSKLHYFSLVFGIFRIKVIFTLGWPKICSFLFPRHSQLNLATFTVSAEINTRPPLPQAALIR